jgi:hypothetical protein
VGSRNVSCPLSLPFLIFKTKLQKIFANSSGAILNFNILSCQGVAFLVLFQLWYLMEMLVCLIPSSLLFFQCWDETLHAACSFTCFHCSTLSLAPFFLFICLFFALESSHMLYPFSLVMTGLIKLWNTWRQCTKTSFLL